MQYPGFYFKFPHTYWAMCPIKELSMLQTGMQVFRLRFFPFPGHALSTCVMVASEETIVSTCLFSVSKPPLNQRQLFITLSGLIGSEILDAKSGTQFTRELSPILAQCVEDCKTNCCDGWHFVHEACFGDAAHSIWIHNPAHHSNQSYTELVKCYSKHFWKNAIQDYKWEGPMKLSN